MCQTQVTTQIVPRDFNANLSSPSKAPSTNVKNSKGLGGIPADSRTGEVKLEKSGSSEDVEEFCDVVGCP